MQMTVTPPDRRRALRHGVLIGAALALQGVCGFFFVAHILLAFLEIPVAPIPWALREYLEIGAALGLSCGVALGSVVLIRALKARRRAEERLNRARGDFREHLEARFGTWGLTPAEADVAIFAIKGLRTQEIADMRRTSEGTVKAQTNAIYRKAGVNGRTQLLSLFIEDLMEGDLPQPAVTPLRQAA